MRAVLIYDRDKRHQRASMTAMAAGMSRHGIDARLERSPGWAAADDDFVVTWCDKELHQTARAAHLILECGYINGTAGAYEKNRLRFISTSWNKRHGLSDWNWTQEAPADRWDALEIELRPWTSGGEYTLLLEQDRRDAAAPPVDEFRRWATEECARRGWPCRVRHHPRHRDNKRTLAEDLARAARAITWASTSAVEAVIAGVHTYVIGPGSIARTVAALSLDHAPYGADRAVWANRLAYRQWTLDELADGSAWPHIYAGLTGVTAQ